MIEPQDGSVRQSVASFAQATRSQNIREVGAPLLRRLDLRCRGVSVEWLQRRGQGHVPWRYRQDRHAIFLFERGILGYDGTINGRQAAGCLEGATRLAFVPAGVAAEATFQVPAKCSYVVALFDLPNTVETDESVHKLGIPPPQIGFAEPRLIQAVAQLRQELQQDQLSNLMLEGWAIQTWALLHRVHAPPMTQVQGLRPGVLRAVLNFIREHLSEDMSVTALAAIAGLGLRQFCRQFQLATGLTPARARDAMRLEMAAHLLATTKEPVTAIALDCGFSQPQHLATAIKRHYGKTPTELRR